METYSTWREVKHASALLRKQLFEAISTELLSKRRRGRLHGRERRLALLAAGEIAWHSIIGPPFLENAGRYDCVTFTPRARQARRHIAELSRLLDRMEIAEKLSLQIGADYQLAEHIGTVHPADNPEAWTWALCNWYRIVPVLEAALRQRGAQETLPAVRSARPLEWRLAGAIARAWQRITGKWPACSNADAPFYEVYAAAWQSLKPTTEAPDPATVRAALSAARQGYG